LEATAALTVMLKADKEADIAPLLTEMTMLDDLPTALEVGVPVTAPVCALIEAHEGRLVALNVRVSPFGSLAVGVKL